MSTHFWMMAGVTAAASTILGLSLGSYATSPQRSAAMDDFAIETAAAMPSDTDSASYAPVQQGPALIRCTGCGPTLADRRWHADMAAMDDVEDMGDPIDPVYADVAPVLSEPMPVIALPAPTPQRAALAIDSTAPAPIAVARTIPDRMGPDRMGPDRAAPSPVPIETNGGADLP